MIPPTDFNQRTTPIHPQSESESQSTTQQQHHHHQRIKTQQNLQPILYGRRVSARTSGVNQARVATVTSAGTRTARMSFRKRPENTWDPTSERAKKVAKPDDGEKVEVSTDAIMMTDDFVDEDDDNDGSDKSLSKCLVHLPKNWDSDNLKKFMDEQGVLCKSAKKKKGMAVGFVSFESAEQAKNAVKELDGISVENKSLKVADVVPRSLEKKAKAALPLHSYVLDSDDIEASSTLGGSALKGRSARDVVTPLAHMTNEDQLEHQKNSLTLMLKRLTRHARKACPSGISLPEWILKSKDIGGLPCKFEGILGSPLVNGYRNKWRV